MCEKDRSSAVSSNRTDLRSPLLGFRLVVHSTLNTISSLDRCVPYCTFVYRSLFHCLSSTAHTSVERILA